MICVSLSFSVVCNSNMYWNDYWVVGTCNDYTETRDSFFLNNYIDGVSVVPLHQLVSKQENDFNQ